jgi:peptidoglycan hydrolase-like protein with peptidoglycan-binding domain
LSIASRLACAAVVALGLSIPAGASAEAASSSNASAASAGGSMYGSQPAPSTAASGTARAHAARHLGDRVPIRRGMSGHDVKILQDFINRLGMKVTVDGTFGSGTYKAVRRFQKRAALNVNGVLDATSLDKLRQIVDEGGFGLPTAPPAPAATPLPAGSTATLNPDGTATAPANAPAAVQAMIAAGNEIATKPYKYGGGHGNWQDSGYDCSGSVSYVLHGAGLLSVSRDSTGLESFGEAGKGQWVTVYGNSGHAYMVVAGLRFDTSGRSKAGTRWQADQRPSDGYVVRHPAGL